MNHGGNRENDALIFLVFTDFESGRGFFPGVSLRSTLGYSKRYAFPCFARLPHKITTEATKQLSKIFDSCTSRLKNL